MEYAVVLIAGDALEMYSVNATINRPALLLDGWVIPAPARLW